MKYVEDLKRETNTEIGVKEIFEIGSKSFQLDLHVRASSVSPA